MWTSGTTEQGGRKFTWHVKHFDEGSQFGIEEGRVSKLEISEGWRNVVNYDRGWDVRPDEADADVMAVFTALLKRFN
ncbi:MAG: hypothetical protein IJR14_08025 [Synergistaceae bacterium]|nr:hypothetical protein [Synergistaceae bacterium]